MRPSMANTGDFASIPSCIFSSTLFSSRFGLVSSSSPATVRQSSHQQRKHRQCLTTTLSPQIVSYPLSTSLPFAFHAVHASYSCLTLSLRVDPVVSSCHVVSLFFRTTDTLDTTPGKGRKSLDDAQPRRFRQEDLYCGKVTTFALQDKQAKEGDKR